MSERAKLHRQIHYFSLLCIALLLPFARTGSTTPMILLMVNFMISGNYKDKWERWLSIKWFWVPIVYYAVMFTGIFWSSDLKNAIKELELKSSFLYLPLIISGMGNLSRYEIKKILRGFVIACLMISLFAFGRALYLQLFNHESHWLYTSLIDFGNMHTSYMALYIASSVFILLSELSEQTKNARRLVIILCIVWLYVFAFMLSARTELLALLLLSMISFIVKMVFEKKYFLAFLSPLLLIGLVCILIMQVPALRGRFESMRKVSYRTSDQTRYINSDNSRASTWQAAWNIIKRYPLTGVGTGDVPSQLKKEFKRIGFVKYKHIQNMINAHNQWLESWLAQGIAGLIAFSALVFVPWYKAMKEKKFVFIMIMSLFIIANLSECMLEAQSGVVFLSFFLCLYMSQSENEGKEIPEGPIK